MSRTTGCSFHLGRTAASLGVGYSSALIPSAKGAKEGAVSLSGTGMWDGDGEDPALRCVESRDPVTGEPCVIFIAPCLCYQVDSVADQARETFSIFRNWAHWMQAAVSFSCMSCWTEIRKTYAFAVSGRSSQRSWKRL